MGFPMMPRPINPIFMYDHPFTTEICCLSACLDDYIDTDNPVRVIDLFVDELDLVELGFEGTIAAATGRPGYHPALLLKIYILGG